MASALPRATLRRGDRPLLCVRWYLRYSLTYRDPEEIMAEWNLSVDHVTNWRWVQRYASV
jgi:transposase-like protein